MLAALRQWTQPTALLRCLHALRSAGPEAMAELRALVETVWGRMGGVAIGPDVAVRLLLVWLCAGAWGAAPADLGVLGEDAAGRAAAALPEDLGTFLIDALREGPTLRPLAEWILLSPPAWALWRTAYLSEGGAVLAGLVDALRGQPVPPEHDDPLLVLVTQSLWALAPELEDGTDCPEPETLRERDLLEGMMAMRGPVAWGNGSRFLGLLPSLVEAMVVHPQPLLPQWLDLLLLTHHGHLAAVHPRDALLGVGAHHPHPAPGLLALLPPLHQGGLGLRVWYAACKGELRQPEGERHARHLVRDHSHLVAVALSVLLHSRPEIRGGGPPPLPPDDRTVELAHWLGVVIRSGRPQLSLPALLGAVVLSPAAQAGAVWAELHRVAAP